MTMLFSHRRAFESMPRWWRPVHLALWRAYWPLARFAGARLLWRAYRRTWP